jgi:hypothetical protein
MTRTQTAVDRLDDSLQLFLRYRKVLQAYFADALPLEVFKREQTRIAKGALGGRCAG